MGFEIFTTSPLSSEEYMLPFQKIFAETDIECDVNIEISDKNLICGVSTTTVFYKT